MRGEEEWGDAHRVVQQIFGLPDDKIALETVVIERGLGNVGCFLHNVVGGDPPLQFIEKRTRHKNEALIAPALQALLLPEGKSVGPVIYDIVDHHNYQTIYMEFIAGEDFRARNTLISGDFQKVAVDLAACLAVVASYQGDMPTRSFARRKVVKDLEDAAERPEISEASRAMLLQMRTVIPRKISKLMTRLPKVASHNDVTFGNLLQCEDGRGGQCIRLIDWALCTRNILGSEMHHFIKHAVEYPRLKPFVDELIQQYQVALAQKGINVYLEDIYLGGSAYAWVRAVSRLKRKHDDDAVHGLAEMATLIKPTWRG